MGPLLLRGRGPGPGFTGMIGIRSSSAAPPGEDPPDLQVLPLDSEEVVVPPILGRIRRDHASAAGGSASPSGSATSSTRSCAIEHRSAAQAGERRMPRHRGACRPRLDPQPRARGAEGLPGRTRRWPTSRRLPSATAGAACAKPSPTSAAPATGQRSSAFASSSTSPVTRRSGPRRGCASELRLPYLGQRHTWPRAQGLRGRRPQRRFRDAVCRKPAARRATAAEFGLPKPDKQAARGECGPRNESSESCAPSSGNRSAGPARASSSTPARRACRPRCTPGAAWPTGASGSAFRRRSRRVPSASRSGPIDASPPSSRSSAPGGAAGHFSASSSRRGEGTSTAPPLATAAWGVGGEGGGWSSHDRHRDPGRAFGGNRAPAVRRQRHPHRPRQAHTYVAERISHLRDSCTVHLLTADTFGTLTEVARSLGVEGRQVAWGIEKRNVARKLGLAPARRSATGGTTSKCSTRPGLRSRSSGPRD